MRKNIAIIVLALFLSISAFLLAAAYSSIEALKSSLAEKAATLEQTRVNLTKLQVEYATLKTIAEENKFLFYYIPHEPVEKPRYGVADLAQYLSKWQWKEMAYKESKFDCSEMSALLEWQLEREGFHTVIVAGSTPTGTGGKHAWVLVETSPGQWTPVESSLRSIVYKWAPFFDNYFKYDCRFETIQEALAYNLTEFDWWQ